MMIASMHRILLSSRLVYSLCSCYLAKHCILTEYERHKMFAFLFCVSLKLTVLQWFLLIFFLSIIHWIICLFVRQCTFVMFWISVPWLFVVFFFFANIMIQRLRYKNANFSLDETFNQWHFAVNSICTAESRKKTSTAN